MTIFIYNPLYHPNYMKQKKDQSLFEQTFNKHKKLVVEHLNEKKSNLSNDEYFKAIEDPKDPNYQAAWDDAMGNNVEEEPESTNPFTPEERSIIKKLNPKFLFMKIGPDDENIDGGIRRMYYFEGKDYYYYGIEKIDGKYKFLKIDPEIDEAHGMTFSTFNELVDYSKNVIKIGRK